MTPDDVLFGLCVLGTVAWLLVELRNYLFPPRGLQ